MVVDEQIHLGAKLDAATLDSLADFVCGDIASRYPVYRSSMFLTSFFENASIQVVHDGQTRKWWVLDVLKKLEHRQVEQVILRLVDLREYKGDRSQLALAVDSMNSILAMDGFAIDFDGLHPILVRATPTRLTLEDLRVNASSPSEAAFLIQQFSDNLQVEELNLDPVLTQILQSRINEIKACPRDKVHLGSIFLLGSTFEGLLIGIACKSIDQFMTAKSAPKDKSGVVRKIHEWKLAELIDTSHEIGLLNLDVKKFSHVLRDFRNYIHPYHQMSNSFMPDQGTVDICWQVFKAAFAQLKASSQSAGSHQGLGH